MKLPFSLLLAKSLQRLHSLLASILKEGGVIPRERGRNQTWGRCNRCGLLNEWGRGEGRGGSIGGLGIIAGVDSYVRRGWTRRREGVAGVVTLCETAVAYGEQKLDGEIGLAIDLAHGGCGAAGTHFWVAREGEGFWGSRIVEGENGGWREELGGMGDKKMCKWRDCGGEQETGRYYEKVTE